MILQRLSPRLRLGLWSALLAPALGSVIACAQKPEERPLTPQEAQQELASFQDIYKNSSVHLTPSAQVKLDSGVVITVTSARVVNDRIFVSGTIRNATPTAIPAGTYSLALIESFEFQVAKFQKEPVRIGSCGGPCFNSHNEMHVSVKSLAPGRSVAYSVNSRDFAQLFPKAKASDMIVVADFYRTRQGP